MRDKVPLLYLFFYGVLLNRFKYSCVSPSYFVETLRRRVPRIPRGLCYEILREMEYYKLIRRENHKLYCLLPNKSIKKLEHLNYDFII